MNISGDKVLIRRLRKEDAGPISRIHTAITKTPDRNNFKKVFAEHAERTAGVSFVAEVDGEVVGYMISYILTGGFGIERSAWIAMFGVEPKLMGQGIGKALAEETFKFYREKGIKNIYTSVRWDSTDLLSFFKTLGFERSHFINLRKELD